MTIAMRLGLLGLAMSALAGCATSGEVIVDDRSISTDDGGRHASYAARDRRDGRVTQDDRDDARRDGAVEIVPLRDERDARGRNRPSPLPSSVRESESPITTLPSTPLAETHVVSPGDTLYGIAFRNGLDFRALAAWNDVPPPFTIKTGQRLLLTPPNSAERRAPTPESFVTAPIATSPIDAAPIDNAPSPRPMTNAPPPAVTSSAPTPSAQQNLPSNVEELRDAPEAPRDPSLYAGANAAPATNVSTPPPVAASTNAPRVTTENTARPASTGAISAAIAGTPAPRATTTPPPPKPIATPTPPVTAATTVDTGPSQTVAGIRWRWPARGQLVARFTAGDAARQGVDIQGTVGQAVAAAADGEVVYSGNGLLGYGELIIIKHSPEFLSAYGYNRRRLVNEGQRVKAGQAIAEMGQTGAALSLVHFEIRQAGRPVDPLRFLPRR